jgi:hypothetical protein
VGHVEDYQRRCEVVAAAKKHRGDGAPFPTVEYGDVLFVEYTLEGKALRPFSIVTTAGHYDVEYCKSRHQLYAHDSGSGEHEGGEVHLGCTFNHEGPPTRFFWAASSMKPVRSAKRRGEWNHHVPVPPSQYGKLGYERLPALTGDPFENAIEGRCTYCPICDDYLPEQDGDWLCVHQVWCDGGYYVGSGADVGDLADWLKRHLEPVLRSVGLNGARKIREMLRNPRVGYAAFSGCFYDSIHDVPSELEEGFKFLDTLSVRDKRVAEHVRATLAAVEVHVAARVEAALCDPNPRRLVRDGAGRYYTRGGTWTPFRSEGWWMLAGPAHATRKTLRTVHPGVTLRVVHVLPAPTRGAPR